MASRKRVRIIYVHHRPEGGGAPRSLALLLEALGERVSACVVTPEGPAAELFRGAGAEVHTAPAATFTHIWASSYSGARWGLLAREAARLPAHVRALRSAIRAYRPEIVHLNDGPLVVAARVARAEGVPVVWHLRSALPAGGGRRSNAMRSEVERNATVALAINSDVAASFGTSNVQVQLNPATIPASPGGADPEAKRALGLDPERPAVGMLSNLYAFKGWSDLLSAAEVLRDMGTPVQTVIAGSAVRSSSWFSTPKGRAAARLGMVEDTERAIRSRAAGLDGLVKLVGSAEPAAIYSALDIVCFPSRGPELGRPVIEGQAYGLPVVTSGSSGGGGVIEDGVTGLLVPPADPRALARAIERLAGDAELRRRIGSQARTHAERAYDPGRVAEQVLDTYARVTRRT